MAEDTLARNPSGRMYEVNINADPEHFLDWDKPIHQQHPEVAKKMEQAYPGLIEQRTQPDKSPTVQGAFPYGMNDKVVANLREAGIPGIKYLDQGSRSEGEGTHNYVVFHHSIVDILKKYGLGALVAGGAAHFKTQPHEGDPFAASQ